MVAVFAGIHLFRDGKGVGIVEFATFVFVSDEAFADWAGGCVGWFGDVEAGFEDEVDFFVASIFHGEDFFFFPCKCDVREKSMEGVNQRR